jgi:signal transduction histidine kinase
VLCDRRLATEALIEILKNAIRFTPPAEKVGFRVVAVGGDRVRFEIEDRGPGVPDQLMDAGLETGAGPATGAPGLGLVIAKAIVDLHGGHFGIMSEGGVGTEVFLSFPRAFAADGESLDNAKDRIFSSALSET